MNELSKQNNDLVRGVKDLDKYIEREQIPSIGIRSQSLNLLDYELYFRNHYVVRFNEVSTKYERAQLVIKEGDIEESAEWVELEVSELHNDMIRAGAKVKGVLTDSEIGRMLSDRRLVPNYDPILGYFKSLTNKIAPDDDFDYIDDFANYLTVEGGDKENDRWKKSFKKALVRTVKCAIDHRYFNKHALILYSTNQSVGKTSYLRTLIPPQLQEYGYQGSIGNDTDSQRLLGKNFFINLDELANLSRTDLSVLKAVLSQLSINIRLPYAKNFTEMPRRASFFGSTNRTDFLTDSENVRWLVFNVEDIDRSYGNVFTGEYNVDIDKVWAQAYKLHLNKEFNPELTKDDLAVNEDNNVLYSATSLEKEVIQTYITPATTKDGGKKGYRRGQSSEIFEEVCRLLEEDGKMHSLKNLKQNIFFIELGRMNGFKKTSYRVGGRPVSGYHYIVLKEMDSSELPF